MKLADLIEAVSMRHRNPECPPRHSSHDERFAGPPQYSQAAPNNIVVLHFQLCAVEFVPRLHVPAKPPSVVSRLARRPSSHRRGLQRKDSVVTESLAMEESKLLDRSPPIKIKANTASCTKPISIGALPSRRKAGAPPSSRRPPTEYTQITGQYVIVFHSYNQDKSLTVLRVPKIRRGPMHFE